MTDGKLRHLDHFDACLHIPQENPPLVQTRSARGLRRLAAAAWKSEEI